MKKEYGKALREALATCMKMRFLMFTEVKVNSLYFYPGDRAYRWIPRKPLHCWVVLETDKKGYDRFNVLVGWSKLARYPELSMIPCADNPTPNREEFAKQEYLTRLPSLWDDRQDYWWEVRKFEPPTSVEDIIKSMEQISGAAARDAISPLVDDALAKIEEYAIPYLKELCNGPFRPVVT